MDPVLLFTPGMTAPNARPKILISDDEPKLAVALAREARRLGLEAIAETSSENLERVVCQAHPAVVILDLHQQQDGRDLLARLKKNPETRGVKVIVLSGDEDQFVRTTCLELGAEDFEVKPHGPVFMKKVARMAGLDAA